MFLFTYVLFYFLSMFYYYAPRSNIQTRHGVVPGHENDDAVATRADAITSSVSSGRVSGWQQESGHMGVTKGGCCFCVCTCCLCCFIWRFMRLRWGSDVLWIMFF